MALRYIVQTCSHDPAWNLALEQTLLETTQEDLFLLWQNGPSIIIGRNQNPHGELDLAAVQSLGIPVIRRTTGGGAVYHDLGNLNFSYIERDAQAHFGNFARYTKPILEALHALHLPATLSGRNDLLLDGRKFSGNAQFLWRDRMLHHGTLLLNANLHVLGQVLRPDPSKLQGKGVRSIQSRVMNLTEARPDLTLEALVAALCDSFAKAGAKPIPLAPAELSQADALADQRYRRWDWNWGHTPGYTWHKKIRLPQGGYEIYLTVEQGIVRAASIQGDFMAVAPIEALTEALVGIAHDRQALQEALMGLPVEQATGGLTQEALCGILTQ